MVVACPAVSQSHATCGSGEHGNCRAEGIIIKGGRYLEALAKVDTLVVDKTGTLR